MLRPSHSPLLLLEMQRQRLYVIHVADACIRNRATRKNAFCGRYLSSRGEFSVESRCIAGYENRSRRISKRYKVRIIPVETSRVFMMIRRSHDKTLYAWIVNAAERTLHTLKRISPHKVALANSGEDKCFQGARITGGSPGFIQFFCSLTRPRTYLMRLHQTKTANIAPWRSAYWIVSSVFTSNPLSTRRNLIGMPPTEGAASRVIFLNSATVAGFSQVPLPTTNESTVPSSCLDKKTSAPLPWKKPMEVKVFPSDSAWA